MRARLVLELVGTKSYEMHCVIPTFFMHVGFVPFGMD